MSFVFTLMTLKPDGKLGAKAFIISNQPSVKSNMCRLVYVCAHICICAHTYTNLFPYVFIYSILDIYLLGCVHECVRKFPSEKALKNSPQGLSDIWLRMDSLYLQVICPVKPLGAAAVHIITTLLQLCSELR